MAPLPHVALILSRSPNLSEIIAGKLERGIKLSQQETCILFSNKHVTEHRTLFFYDHAYNIVNKCSENEKLGAGGTGIATH